MNIDLAPVIAGALERGAFPSASWLVWERDRILSRGTLGEPDLARPGEQTLEQTAYDLASLTKPLLTAPLVLKTLAQKGLAPDTPAAQAGLEGTLIGGSTFAELLTHCAGLPVWKPLYAMGETPGEAFQALLNLQPGERGTARYGCPAYLLLGRWLQEQGADMQGEAAPLRFNPLKQIPPLDSALIAPTERAREFEVTMARNDGFEVPDPGPVLPGEVHDGNAAFLGGVAGNAGLFGTAAEVRERLQDLLTNPELKDLFEPLPGLHRSLGCVLASDPDSHAHGVLPADAAGHTGFTGTMFWVHPPSGWGAVLLTNRIHPTVGPSIEGERKLFLQGAWGLSSGGAP